MAKLFKSYIHLSHWPERLARMLICVPLYLAMMVSIIFLLHDLPTYLLIRGPRSHLFDTRMLLLLTFLSQFVLFWVFDYSLLTNRVLNYISHHAVCWPDTTRRKNAVKFGVTEDDISGLVSVDYAAVQTAWAAPMMFWPIILQLLLVFSRCPYFDNWTWPPGLILVFAMNFLMAIACWWMVRRAAYLVQKKALKRLNETILAVKISPEKSPFNIPDPKANEALSVDRDIYLKNLKRVRKEIREERRGAFAKWFQDPSYLAIFIPSGASGIITLFAAYFLKK